MFTAEQQKMKIILANPRGFCAGVDRAVEIVNQALATIGKPIYVKHQVVHNKYVVSDLEARGAIFIEDLNEVPAGATLIFSAHGVSQAVRQQAKERGFQIFDATCPLVTKVHNEVTHYDRHGIECVLIGHAGHPEVEGTMGQYHNTDGGIYLVENETDVDKLELKDPQNVAYITQTTLSVDDTGKIIEALRRKFPLIQGPKKDDICYATQNRQDAVKKLTEQCDVVLVVGSKASSNSNRLRELADRMGKPAYLIDQASDLQRSWFKKTDIIGITAGASAPEILVKDIITQLKAWGATDTQEMAGVKEDIVFALPKELR
jgi:4-hydroxy-3-methylbut-2-enyl diphosphate reductase